MAKKRSSLWFWIGLVAVISLLFALPFSATFKNAVAEAIAWAESVMSAHPVVGAAVFFLFAAISAMLAFTSSVVLVPPANLVWGKLITFLLLWGGWIAGAIAAFGIGKVARPLLVRLGYQNKLSKYQQFVSRRMKFWTTILFCIAVPSEIPGYILGGLRYPFLKFLGAIAIAESIYAWDSNRWAESCDRQTRASHYRDCHPNNHCDHGTSVIAETQKTKIIKI